MNKIKNFTFGFVKVEGGLLRGTNIVEYMFRKATARDFV